MQEIRLTRGDSLRLELEVYYDDGSVYELEEGDKLVFTLKKSVNDQKVILQMVALN